MSKQLRVALANLAEKRTQKGQYVTLEEGRNDEKVDSNGDLQAGRWRMSAVVEWVKTSLSNLWVPTNIAKMRDVAKITMASFLCVLLVMIPSTRELLGRSPQLAPVSVVYLNPTRTFGSMIETVLLTFLTVPFFALICIFAILCRAAQNKQIEQSGLTTWEDRWGGVVQGLWLWIALWLIGYFRAKFPRLNNAILISSIIVVFELTDGSFESKASFSHLSDILPSFIRSGSRNLRNLMDTSLLDIRELLNALVKAFCECKDMTPATIAQAELELSYSRYSPQEYSLLLVPLENMMKHFSGMESVIKTSQELLASSKGSPDIGKPSPTITVSEADLSARMKSHHVGDFNDEGGNEMKKPRITQLGICDGIDQRGSSCGIEWKGRSRMACMVGTLVCWENYIFAQKDAFNLIAMAAASCIGGVVRILETGEAIKNIQKANQKFGVGRTEEALEDLDKALKIARVHLGGKSFFMASFFEVSLREAAVEIRNLVHQAVMFEKAIAKRGMRFWLPSASAKDLLRSTDSLGVNSINPSADLSSQTTCKESKKTENTDDLWGPFAWPAFVFPEEFDDMRGAWGLTSLIVVLSPTVGGIDYVWVLSNRRDGCWCCIWVRGLECCASKLGYDCFAVDVFLGPMLGSWKRLVIMCIGVISAIILSSSWWPYIARIQLRNDIARSLNAVGVFYSLIVVLLIDPEDNHFVPNPPEKNNQGPLENILHNIFHNLKDHAGFDVKQGDVKSSNKVAVHQAAALANREADGFGVGGVGTEIEGTVSDRNASDKNGLGDVHNRLILPIAKYRRDMAASILLYTYVLNGSVASRTPLPIFMPAARAMRLRVISRLPPLSIPVGAKHEDILGYSHFFAFCLMQQEIIEELEKLAGHVRCLFGPIYVALHERVGIIVGEGFILGE
ncbi:hypothetical protein BC829DRAFT_448268 [Chytridium lagenaria]|nr:hypothetical protein BC829DRAFT_448268 [Chytridium lagenaria]